jgi:hypothetical protein
MVISAYAAPDGDSIAALVSVRSLLERQTELGRLVLPGRSEAEPVTDMATHGQVANYRHRKQSFSGR